MLFLVCPFAGGGRGLIQLGSVHGRLQLVIDEVTELRFLHRPLWCYSRFLVHVAIVLNINRWCLHSWHSSSRPHLPLVIYRRLSHLPVFRMCSTCSLIVCGFE